MQACFAPQLVHAYICRATTAFTRDFSQRLHCTLASPPLLQICFIWLHDDGQILATLLAVHIAIMAASNNDGLSISQYKHQPIDSQEEQIRLLQIIDNHSDNISTTLRTFNLKECPDYVALSYTWGAPSLTRSIQIDGCAFTIRQNLWDFFDQVRHVRKRIVTLDPDGTENIDLHGTFFWIDQVCIQQSSNVERNHQVGMMGQIFTRAEEVFVWLGGWNSRPNTKHTEDDLMLGELCQRPYWQRLWVIQEIMVARSVAIVLGDALIDWDCFFQFPIRIPLGSDDFLGGITNIPHGVRVRERKSMSQLDINPTSGVRTQKRELADSLDSTRWLSQSCPADPQARAHTRPPENLHSTNMARGTFPSTLEKSAPGQRRRRESFDSLDFARHTPYSPFEELPKIVQSIYNERELFCAVGQGNSLSYVLELFSFQGSRCENARDKVYGLLGLVKQDVAIEVDYQRSIEEVYRDVLSKIIHQENYLTREELVEFSQLLKTSMALHDLDDREVKNSVIQAKEKEETDWDTFVDDSFRAVQKEVGQALDQFCQRDGDLDPMVECIIQDCHIKLELVYIASRKQVLRVAFYEEPRQELERLVKNQCDAEKRELKTLALESLYEQIIALMEPKSLTVVRRLQFSKLSKPAMRELQRLREKLEQAGVANSTLRGMVGADRYSSRR